jgi:DtxR family Mn-dependent transcriptional regulator
MYNNTNQKLTRKERDCILYIRKGSKDDFPVRVSDIAKTMNVKPPTIEELLNRMEEKALIKRKHGMITLTKSGNRMYNDIILTHRVLEIFFVECGVKLTNACEEISNFDYLINIDTARMILTKLGNPKTCPHGDPILPYDEENGK